MKDHSTNNLKTPLNSIVNGIKTVGVGRRGSQQLSEELTEEIIKDIQAKNYTEAALGAFLGALLIKGPTITEKKIETVFFPEAFSDPAKLIETLAPQSSPIIQKLCTTLSQNNILNYEESKTLGSFLLSKDPCEFLKGFAASILRVRYETAEEYQGLLDSAQNTLSEGFKHPAPKGKPILQFAEPFDGFDHSYAITPLVTHFFSTQGYRVVTLVGRNSGPKYGNNLLDIGKKIKATFLTSSQDLKNPQPDFGWYLNQKDISENLDHWVDIRQKILKRPFLATLERFINPVGADICIASAFHPPYGEKMIEIGERAGYRGVIIIRNGLEGSMAFALKRNAKILCSARQKNGSYVRHAFEIKPEEIIKEEIKVEEKLTDPSIDTNISLINTFHGKGQTDYSLFNWRVKVTCTGIKNALEWCTSSMLK